MVRKSAQFTKAVELRKRGFTYEEIAKLVGVSKSSISNWLSRETWSVRVRENNQKRAARDNSKRISLLNKARTNQFEKLYTEAEHSAKTEFKHYKANPLFIAGLMLYVSLGDQDPTHPIRLSSARLEAHRIFIRFVQEYLGVPREKIRFLPFLYPSASAVSTLERWAKTIRLPASQFHKYQVIPNIHSKQPLRSGVGNTIIGGTVLKRKLIVWVKLASREF